MPLLAKMDISINNDFCQNTNLSGNITEAMAGRAKIIAASIY
jgi:hypothetical protein